MDPEAWLRNYCDSELIGAFRVYWELRARRSSYSTSRSCFGTLCRS